METSSFNITARRLWIRVNQYIANNDERQHLLGEQETKTFLKHFGLIDRFSLVISISII
jgi:hypothetical protein